MLLTVLPVVLFHGRSAGGETQWGGSDGPPAWPLPPVAAAADRTPPVLRAGRAAHRSQSALEPFYKRRRCPVSNATMLTQRYNAGWVGGGKLPSRSYSFWRLFPLRCITTCFSLPRRGSLHRQGFPGSAEKLKLIWAQCRSAAIFAVTKNRFRQVLRRIVSGVAVCNIPRGNAHITTAKPTESSATTSLLQYN